MNLFKSFALLCSLAAFGLFAAESAWCTDVDVAEAPTNDLALTVSAINGAQQSVQLNIYELSSPDIANALLGRIQAGVQVQILEEGQPVGGMSSASKDIVSQLVQAMQSANSGDFLYEMTSKAKPKAKRRFRYDHAKYMVIDGDELLIGSENYSPTGNPEPGTVGNRGWEVLLHDPSLARTFAQTFASDSDPSHSDIMNMSNQGVAYAFNLTDTMTDTMTRKPKPKPLPPVPAPFPGRAQAPTPAQAESLSMSASAISSFTSPDSSLSGLQGIFENAASSIDIELMTFHADWGTAGSKSPLLTALIAAAQRGVKIRVLLNDESVFNQDERTSKPVNPVTLQALQNAAAQGLPIQALIANVKAMGVDYIHNKGALIDGDQTMISSINWDENSIQHNREAAVVITSPNVYDHYESLFEQDWEASGGQPGNVGSSAQAYRAQLAQPIDGVQGDSLNCPNAVHVAVQIGQIAPQAGQDASFASLSGQSFNLTMTRDRAGKSCIFVSADRLGGRRVFEIRSSSGGTLFILEGYTSAGKLYSIHARSYDGIESSQDMDARVFEGSGGHQALGDAEMQVSPQ